MRIIFSFERKRKLLAFLWIVNASLLISFYSPAQRLHWNTTPQQGFVFKINNKEAQKLLTLSFPDTLFNGLLHKLVDTFDVDKGWTDRPDKGHFILARIVENNVHCEYTSIFPYQVFLLKDYDALSLQVVDLDGNVREDAKVKFRLKRLSIDPQSKTYRIEHNWFPNSNRFVTVELDGFRSVFNIEKHEVPQWENNWSDDDNGPSFYSYMITDKNKYKPNEKIRFKSYALSQSRIPLRKDLELWLFGDRKTLKMTQVSPHHPGCFAGEFQLHDSLQLSLDKYYSLQLRDKNGRIVSTCSFKYEDYELNGNKLEVKLATATQFHPAKNALTITATDINGLILKDARASILVKTQSIRETFQPLVILPDTLWFTEINLNADSPTTLDISSDIFGKTNTVYEVNVTVINSQNQRIERKVSAMHYYSQYSLTTTFSHDSIVYQLLNNNEPMSNVAAKVKYSDEIDGKEIMLPYKEKLNPVLSTVSLQTDFASREIYMRNLIPHLELKGGIQKDSFNIVLENPQELEVSWYVYQGSVLLEKGFGTEIDYKSKIEDRTQTYYVELLYSFGAQENLKRKEYPFREDYLNVSLDIPDRVYPGQEVQALIRVTNQLGDPISGVDLTALAVTGKLDYYLPDLPYYGTISASRYKKAHYSKKEVNKRFAIIDLDYEKWQKLARLDTMKYYQFTYPCSAMFNHAVAINDSTQFSAYVMKKGSAMKIYVIEVNRKPVYYSWTDQPQHYSFYAIPQKKQEITLRLYDRVLILDSLSFQRGRKTILSIDLDNLPSTVKTIKLYETRKKRRRITYPSFTPTELNRHNMYISSFNYVAGNAYLESGREFTPLFSAQSSKRKQSIIVGPVTPERQTFRSEAGLNTTYQHTGGFTYDFEDNIVYKLNPGKYIPDILRDENYSPALNMNDLVLTKKEFLEYRYEAAAKWHTRVIDLLDHSLRLSVLLPEEKQSSGIAGLRFQNCKTKELLSPCQNRYTSKVDFYIPRGCHHIIVFYNDGKYLKIDSVNLESYNQVVINFNQSAFHPADSLSAKWLTTPGSNCYPYVTTPPRTITLRPSAPAYGNIRGVIYDNTNMPLSGANVVVKGTTNGTGADAEGRFYLNVTDSPVTLVISFIGFQTQEIDVQLGADLAIFMVEDIQYLSEVVVVGYASQNRSNLTAAVSSLSGRAAGVVIGEPDAENAVTVEEEELIEDEARIREAEQKLYQELLTLNQIRSNFSDVGLWEPTLFTDKRGQSRFTVKFPDDIARWDATVYAMNRRLQTGTLRKSIKSYKPIMAELHVPQFLTRGDSAYFLGKVLNYTNDKRITGKIRWSGSSSSFDKDVAFSGFHTDKLPVYVMTTDSVTTSYTFTRDDGYLDGEERSVPVIEQGVIRADGTLGILKGKDKVSIKASPHENVTVEILSNQVDIYAGQVRYLLDYEYACNEQLASKLIGLINHKMLMQYESKPFRYDKDVNKIIARLLKNQNQEFLWSWWDVSPNTSYWMSAHILRALKAARDADYSVHLDIENIARKAEYKFDFLNNYNLQDVDILNALASWGAKLNYAKHIQKLDSALIKAQRVRESKSSWRHSGYSSLKEKMLLLELRQLTNTSYLRDSLMRYKKEAILDQVYFTENKPARYWYEDELAANAVAYRIAKRDSSLNHLLGPMQMYFLSSRKHGGWNTYHSSNILMSVLPDLIAGGATKKHPSTLKLEGKVNETVERFPYRLELKPTEELRISKESGLPLYYMHYRKERVMQAKTGVEGFAIKTKLGKDDMILEAGKPVALTVEVDVKKESTEYVMIEVPIPAACSYADKSQKYNGIETHREYFKERTVIFCENMRTGKYTFVIHLLPRFTGKYLINPAQVSLMYLPVVNANTDMKVVSVSD